MKKKKAKKAAPVKPSPGTKVIGRVMSNYVQVNVSKKHAKSVAEELGNVILADFHRAFCPPHDAGE